MWYQFTSFLNYHLNLKNSKSLAYRFDSDGKLISSHKKISTLKKEQFLSYKNALLNSKEIIEVSDFGSGSKIFKSNSRPVHKIAKVAGISNNNAFQLTTLCEQFQPTNILEIGTSLGLGTFALHLGAPQASITSLEGCKNTAEIARKQLEIFKANTVKIQIGNFDSVLPSLFDSNQFDFIYFDGNHSKKATLTYFNWAIQKINGPAIYIFDDIHWSKEMNEAWTQIKNHPRVSFNCTTYQWGFLFFDKT